MTVLVRRGVSRTLFSMAFPMLAGTFAMNAYNLTDTWFVSRLGTLSLAAMGFTFPVVMLLSCVARGIGGGVTTLFSHAIGRHDQEDAAKLVTHGALLAAAVTGALAVAGYLSMTHIFTKLGADARTLPLIGDYMRIWYAGALFMALPMLGTGILISAGDSRAASGLMILGTVLNAILDPIMIFGLLGCPAMGIRGAALATVIAQAVSTAWFCYLLVCKHRLILLRHAKVVRDLLVSARRITHFALPSVLGLILMPVSASIITKILSRFGNEAVAAGGAASRIEIFAFVVPMALGISLTPFVSQNFGAGRVDRIREAETVANRFAIGYGGAVAVVFFLLAPWLASVFTDDPRVAGILIAQIRITSFGYGMMEVHRYCGFFLAGMHRPVAATLLSAVRVLLLLIPLSCAGAHFWGVSGLFGGRLIADLVSGTLGLLWVAKVLRAEAATRASS